MFSCMRISGHGQVPQCFSYFLIFFFVKTLHSLVDYDEDSDEETGGDEDSAGGSSPAKRQKLDNS